MKEFFAATGGCLLMVFLFVFLTIGGLGMTWITQGNDFFLYKFFAPRKAAVERQVFEETKSYNQGMVQELQNMQFEYAKADADGKAAMKSIILHRAADYDETRLPADLRSFIQGLKAENMKGKFQ